MEEKFVLAVNIEVIDGKEPWPNGPAGSSLFIRYMGMGSFGVFVVQAWHKEGYCGGHVVVRPRRGGGHKEI